MKASLHVEREGLVQSLKNFLNKATSQSRRPQLCPVCGDMMQSMDATFWIYGTDLRWSFPLPVCACESIDPTESHKSAKEDAAHEGKAQRPN